MRAAATGVSRGQVGAAPEAGAGVARDPEQHGPRAGHPAELGAPARDHLLVAPGADCHSTPGPQGPRADMYLGGGKVKKVVHTPTGLC